MRIEIWLKTLKERNACPIYGNYINSNVNSQRNTIVLELKKKKKNERG